MQLQLWAAPGYFLEGGGLQTHIYKSFEDFLQNMPEYSGEKNKFIKKEL
jgi:hypothetical protein